MKTCIIIAISSDPNWTMHHSVSTNSCEHMKVPGKFSWSLWNNNTCWTWKFEEPNNNNISQLPSLWNLILPPTIITYPTVSGHIVVSRYIHIRICISGWREYLFCAYLFLSLRLLTSFESAYKTQFSISHHNYMLNDAFVVNYLGFAHWLYILKWSAVGRWHIGSWFH
jgi:hypothetical protein